MFRPSLPPSLLDCLSVCTIENDLRWHARMPHKLWPTKYDIKCFLHLLVTSRRTIEQLFLSRLFISVRSHSPYHILLTKDNTYYDRKLNDAQWPRQRYQIEWDKWRMVEVIEEWRKKNTCQTKQAVGELLEMGEWDHATMIMMFAIRCIAQFH